MTDSNKIIVRYEVKDSAGEPSFVFIEVDVDPEDAENAVQINNARGVLADASKTFQDALERVKPAIHAVTAALEDINQPDTIALEFGLKLTAATGVVIASASTEVTFKVTLSWKKVAGP